MHPGKPTPPTLEDLFSAYELADPLLTYLNQGGDPDALEASLNTLALEDSEPVQAALQAVDLTGDKQMDLLARIIIPMGDSPEYYDYAISALMGLACLNGQYETIFYYSGDMERFTAYDGHHLLAVQDMNRNGVLDLLVDFQAGNQHIFWVLEWNGEAMAGLIAPHQDPLLFENVQYVQIQAGRVKARDVNGDGLIEIIATREYDFDDMWPHCPGQTDIWAWDGEFFRLNCSLSDN